MSAKKKDEKKNTRPVIKNRRAYHDYEVLESYTAGISLTGTEIKSIRDGKVSLAEGYASVENGQVILNSVNISPYNPGSYNNHDPLRPRKLLLTKKEIEKLTIKVQEKGLTLIPLKLFFSRSWAKVEIGVCRGKKLHDKRKDLTDKAVKRDIDRALKNRY